MCQGRILECPEHRRTSQSPAVGGGVPFILPFPISPPVAPLQIPPAPVGDNPFLYNARKNEIWEGCGISNQCFLSWPSHFVSKHKK